MRDKRDVLVLIDGDMGEGGGQILRTSLTLSLCSGKPFRIINLRARRKKPGFRQQHLVCVNAAAKIGGARIEGATPGSQELMFAPTTIRPGHYHFDIGTAGSTTLVLQSILPALLIANGPSTLILEGGTHNPFAPTFDFLQQVFLPIINRMGPKVEARLERPGYYPKGGGRLSVAIQPAKKLKAFCLHERGKILEQRATATVAGLPRHIAQREIGVIGQKLGWGEECLYIKEEPVDMGPGNIVTIEIKSEYISEVFTGFGERGVRAETVGDKAARAALRYLNAGVPVCDHLADQLLLPFALAGGGSYNTLKPTSHTTTNSEVLKFFMDIGISMDRISKDIYQITLGIKSPLDSLS